MDIVGEAKEGSDGGLFLYTYREKVRWNKDSLFVQREKGEMGWLAVGFL